MRSRGPNTSGRMASVVSTFASRYASERTNSGVEAERDVVHEHVTVDVSQVHRPLYSLPVAVERADDVVTVESEVECQVVPRAGRHDDHRATPSLLPQCRPSPENRRRRPCRARRRRWRPRPAPPGASPGPAPAPPARMPRLVHSSTRWNRSALPPPDLRFMNRTPRVAAGTGVPSVSLCLSAPTVVPSAYFARATATTSATMRRSNETPDRPSPPTMLATDPMSAATATATAIIRRHAVLVSATHTAPTITTSRTSWRRTRRGSATIPTNVSAATATAMRIAPAAADRRCPLGLPPDPSIVRHVSHSSARSPIRFSWGWALCDAQAMRPRVPIWRHGPP